jgi:hypothetical protein
MLQQGQQLLTTNYEANEATAGIYPPAQATTAPAVQCTANAVQPTHMSNDQHMVTTPH